MTEEDWSLLGQIHNATGFSYEGLLFSKNHNSQHSRKLPCPWASGAYRLKVGLKQVKDKEIWMGPSSLTNLHGLQLTGACEMCLIEKAVG